MNTKLLKRDHFHLIGIGGIGMSAIAMALIKKGHSVSGSDLAKNEETQRLKDLGVIIFYSQTKNNIDFVNSKFREKTITFVISSAIKNSNGELSYCIENNYSPKSPRQKTIMV